MSMIRFNLFLLVSIWVIPTSTMAQEVQLQGDWTGTSQWMNKLIPTEYHIIQEGLTLSGTGKLKNLNGKDSALFEFNGGIQGKSLNKVP